MTLSSAAALRLRAYCVRATHSTPDYRDDDRGRHVRSLRPDLWEIVWNDREVRDALLAAGEDRSAWDALLETVGHNRGLALLDLVTVIGAAARART